MISLKAVVVLVCYFLSLSRAAPVDNVDRVLQELALQRSQPQATGEVGDSFNLEEFLDHSNQFKDFVVDYRREYESDDEIVRRFEVFRDNLKEIDFFRMNEQGTAEYGVNEFADQTAEEFKMGLSPLNIDSIEGSKGHIEFQKLASNLNNITASRKVNYKEKGKVLQKVQDQRMCGSCWAHATVATLETAYAIKHNELMELSKQQLVDCDFLDDGCCGGWVHQAYEWIQYVGGLETERDYKQLAFEGKCKFDSKKAKVNVKDYYILYTRRTSDNVAHFEKFLNEIGILAATINANGFRFYKGGIMNQPHIVCSKSTYSLNHAVINIGYDEEVIDGVTYPYWILKNSWGKSWGEDGYMRILKGANVCGLEWISFGVIAA